MVDAVLITFNRRQPFVEVCRSALDQSIPLRTLVIVDNNESPTAADLVGELGPSTTDVQILHPGSNLGPAGGIAAGVRHLRERVGDLDWVLLLDDDDPVPGGDVVERLLDALPSAERDRVAGIALSGATFSPRLLLPKSIDLGAGGLIPVDYLFGGGTPLYRAAALEDVGCFRPELFWGFDDLDVGLRLVRSGWRLYVAADVFLGLPAAPQKPLERSGGPRVGVVEPSPRAYYSLRNTIDIGLRYFGLRHVLLAVVVRALLKPIANLPVHPALAARTLKVNTRAVLDAFRGRLGRTLELDA
jgi:glycosyltransferase involved in cell wall biosynthesis